MCLQGLSKAALATAHAWGTTRKECFELVTMPNIGLFLSHLTRLTAMSPSFRKKAKTAGKALSPIASVAVKLTIFHVIFPCVNSSNQLLALWVPLPCFWCRLWVAWANKPETDVRWCSNHRNSAQLLSPKFGSQRQASVHIPTPYPLKPTVHVICICCSGKGQAKFHTTNMPALPTLCHKGPLECFFSLVRRSGPQNTFIPTWTQWTYTLHPPLQHIQHRWL